jgi:hypothetical protein
VGGSEADVDLFGEIFGRLLSDCRLKDRASSPRCYEGFDLFVVAVAPRAGFPGFAFGFGEGCVDFGVEGFLAEEAVGF